MKPVARLAGTAMADSIGQYDEMLVRVEQLAGIEKLASELATSPAYREEIVVHTRKLLDHPALRAYAGGVWRDIRDNLREDAFSADSVLKAWLREMMEAATQALLRNDGLRGRLNNWMHEVMVEVVQSHQHDVGVLIADTVRGWDTETVTARIERQVGEDLQYIRINGTLIGGLVGLVIYAVSRAFG